MGESRANEPATDSEGTSLPVHTRDRGWYVPLVVAAGLIVLLAVAAGVGVAGTGPPSPQYAAPDSASAAVLEYVAALRKGDFETAESLISTRIKAEDEAWQKLISISQARFGEADVQIVSEAGDSSRATVTVEVTHYEGSGLSRSVWVSQAIVSLVREEGDWKIDTEDLFSI